MSLTQSSKSSNNNLASPFQGGLRGAIKILHVITSLRTGGAEHLMVDLLPRLRDLGNEVELLVFDGTRTAFYEELEQMGIKIHSLGIGSNVYHPRNMFKLRKFVAKYDIIHTHNTACQLFVPVAKILKCSKAKLVIELDGMPHFTTDGKQRDLLRTEILEHYGIKVIRFTNSEVMDHFQEVCDRIDREILDRT